MILVEFLIESRLPRWQTIFKFNNRVSAGIMGHVSVM